MSETAIGPETFIRDLVLDFVNGFTAIVEMTAANHATLLRTVEEQLEDGNDDPALITIRDEVETLLANDQTIAAIIASHKARMP